MNNAPLTLILIASLGIVAVISLGVFFALRPKGLIDDSTYVGDAPQHLNPEPEPKPELTNSKPFEPSPKFVDLTTALPIAPTTKLTKINSPKVHIQTANGQKIDVNRSPAPPGAASPSPAKHPLATTTVAPKSAERTPSARQTTVEVLDSLRASGVVNDEESVKNGVHTLDSGISQNGNFRELKPQLEKDMHHYGKIVGLAYKNKRLYVPSYQSGNISVLSTPNLKLIAEYRCPNCHIYDIGVTSNGDMIVAEGKNEKLAKIDKDGNLVKEIKVDYSTKGLTVTQYDEIFVLPKTHDNVYVYDTKLNELGVIPLPNMGTNDCNFVDYREDLLYISCETALYAVDVQGKLLKTMKPSKGTYAVGVAVDEKGLVLTGLRGTMAMDVFDKQGQYKETIGESQDSLWSDIVVGDGYVYVVDYITATIKSYKY